MARRIAHGIVFLGVALLAACSGEPPTGPVEVKWDRDQCERCRMVVSDPFHAAQIRQPAGQGRTKVYRFDDFGCAVIWLDKQSWRDLPGVEFWVTDHRSGDWIDARKAVFAPGQVTPMEYGLGAQREAADGGGMDFAQAREHVYGVERRFNTHHHHSEGTDTLSPNENTRDR
jgi:hypothetical protein